jgi:hypothetical protein
MVVGELVPRHIEHLQVLGESKDRGQSSSKLVVAEVKVP